MRCAFFALAVLFGCTTVGSSSDESLLRAREAVWRAWFSNDQTSLAQVLPPETIAINPGEEEWQNSGQIRAGAAQFAASGARLVELAFPRTEIRRYGNVAVLYSLYKFEVETGGTRSTTSGRATEIFVWTPRGWTNPGWHLDSGQ